MRPGTEYLYRTAPAYPSEQCALRSNDRVWGFLVSTMPLPTPSRGNVRSIKSSVTEPTFRWLLAIAIAQVLVGKEIPHHLLLMPIRSHLPHSNGDSS